LTAGIERHRDVTTVADAVSIVGRTLETAIILKMPDSPSRPFIPAAITFGIFFAVVLTGSALRFSDQLDGWLGIVFVLLILGAPFSLRQGQPSPSGV